MLKCHSRTIHFKAFKSKALAEWDICPSIMKKWKVSNFIGKFLPLHPRDVFFETSLEMQAQLTGKGKNWPHRQIKMPKNMTVYFHFWEKDQTSGKGGQREWKDFTFPICFVHPSQTCFYACFKSQTPNCVQEGCVISLAAFIWLFSTMRF